MNTDNVRDMKKLTDYICRMGLRKFTCIHGQNSSQAVKSRQKGFSRLRLKMHCMLLHQLKLCPFL